MDDQELLQAIYDIVLTESTDEATDKLFCLFKEQQAKNLGSRGGSATKAKHGKSHYVKLAENMNRKRAEAKKPPCDLRSTDRWCFAHSAYHGNRGVATVGR